MMNPLSAISALTNMGGAMSPAAAAPTGPANAVTENFNLLNNLQGAASPTAAGMSSSTAALGSALPPSTWGHMVHQMVMDVNSKQSDAAAKVADVLKGGPTPVHEAMVSTEEASLSFEMLAEMRNKMVDAYQQIMQMQV